MVSTRLSRRRVWQALSGCCAATFVPAGVLGRAEARELAARAGAEDGLLRGPPEAEGIDPAAILAFLDEVAENGLELHSFMLQRNGKVVAEAWWWPYAPQRPHMMHSLTKSVTGTAVGLALEEGRFALTDPVVSFFPEQLPPRVSDKLAAMTVRDLLTMQTGHAYEVSGTVWRPIETSWVAEFFKIPVSFQPGAKFVYTSAASFMLSAIITKTTGQTMRDYLEPRVFQPLGIRNPSWDVGPGGINPGGNGLSWKTSDSLKLGALYLQQGLWNGMQVIPRHWANEATRQQAREAPYGYQWRIGPGRAFFGSGQFTQLVIGFPDQQTGMAVTAAIMDRDELLPIVWKHFPAALGAGPIASSPLGKTLERRLATARLLAPITPTSSPLAERVSGRRYRAHPNADAVESMELVFQGDRCTFKLHDYRGEHAVEVGLRDWVEGETSMTGNKLHHEYQPASMRVIAGGRWVDPQTFEMTWEFVETAWRDRAVCRFDGDRMRFDHSVNVNSAAMSLPTIHAEADGPSAS